MKASDLKAGMFCIVDRNHSGKKSLCLVMSGIHSEDDDLSVISFAGAESYCPVRSLLNKELLIVFKVENNYDADRALRLRGVPTIDDLKIYRFTILYDKDSKLSTIQARIDTLQLELDQLTQELNSL